MSKLKTPKEYLRFKLLFVFTFQTVTGETLETQQAMNVYSVHLEPIVTLSMLQHVLLVHQDTQHPIKAVTIVDNVQVRKLYLIYLNT